MTIGYCDGPHQKLFPFANYLINPSKDTMSLHTMRRENSFYVSSDKADFETFADKKKYE